MIATLLFAWTVTVPVQRPVPDSAARARINVVLQSVRDSLDRVRGAAYNFRTDLNRASPVVVHSRAQRMQASCVGADAALVRLDSALNVSYPAGAPADLRRESRALRSEFAACRREYDTTARWEQRADSVRAWAPFKLRRLEDAMRRFGRVTTLPRR